ncbi:MAG: phosphatidylserine decarboxylase [Oligoflexia bacterium]|nr:phosphatidylserine decarboxylase [Oligoflexia bacterium]
MIRVWNRAENREDVEQVYGEGLVNWLYGSPSGRHLADHVLSRPFFSAAYGRYQDSRFSRHKILPFIRDFAIPMAEYESAEYGSFNEFFIRKFRPGARPFATDPGRMPAFAEARYLAYEAVSSGSTYPVKGLRLTPAAILGAGEDAGPARETAAPFEGGPMLIARLCPTDYHRFHFPDDGEVVNQYRVGGALHSVNPVALRYREDILATNERQVSLLRTRNFGLLAYVEVGALCVGRIVQTYSAKDFSRGQEKGYFLFGASTVIVLGERGAWRPDDDLSQRTSVGCETLVRLGQPIAGSRRPA